MPPTRRNTKQLVCKFCDRQFAKVDHLDRHVRSHTKEKPFKCDECGRSYTRHDTLLRHARDHNTGSGNSSPDQSIQTQDVDERTPIPGLVISDPAQDVDASNSTDITRTAEVDFASFQPNFVDPTGQNEYTTQGFEAGFPLWLIDDQIKLNLLDFSAEPSADGNRMWASPAQDSLDLSFGRAKDLTSVWFTNVMETNENNQNEPTTSDTTGTVAEIDENYRNVLHRRINVRPQEMRLPSTDFLNSCLRLYFLRFHPIFPVVHPSTFRASKATSMTLISMCSIGCLFTGSTNAMNLAIQMYQSLQKASLARWESVMAAGEAEAVGLVQTALIGQTFGFLSGKPNHLAQVDILHGTVVSWARKSKMFQTQHRYDMNFDVSGEALEKLWHDWILVETKIRICLGLQIHDAGFAKIFHHEGILRHNMMRSLQISSGSHLFMAATAEDWKAQFLFGPTSQEYTNAVTVGSVQSVESLSPSSIPPESLFTAYAALEGLTMEIHEARLLQPEIEHQSIYFKTEAQLLIFYDRFLMSRDTYVADRIELKVLWHLSFMELYSDFEMLEKALGRDGPVLDHEVLQQVQMWARSPDAVRCAAHGALLLRRIESRPLSFEPAIHSSRALFWAGITWYCYIRYGIDSTSPSHQIFEEFTKLQVDLPSLMFELHGFKHQRPARPENCSILFEIADVLRRVGHSEIARVFASILGALIDDSTS